MDLQVELNALKGWEAETELREREVELMERLIDQPNNRAVQMELDEVRRKLHALGCDTEPLLNPTIPAEQSPVVAWTRKAPVHPSMIGAHPRSATLDDRAGWLARRFLRSLVRARGV